MMRVLVVEDEQLIAHSIADILTDGGYEIAGIAASADQVIRLLGQERCDLAVVDANLAGSSSVPVATALVSRAIPYVVVSGYARRELQLPLLNAPFVPKPINARELLDALVTVCESTSVSDRNWG
jgi:DNA-binding response OmpR family regulator